MKWLAEKYMRFEPRGRHLLTKWAAIVSIILGVASLLAGAQPGWLWLTIVAAYTVQLHLLWDIKRLKEKHVTELQKVRVSNLCGGK